MKLALLIPNGVVARNFLLGHFPRVISEMSEIHVLHAIPEKLLPVYGTGFNCKIDWEPMISYGDTPISYTLRNALSYGHMKWANTKTMSYNFNLQIKGSWKRQTAARTARLMGRVAAKSARLMSLLEGSHYQAVARSKEVESYRALFQRTQPSLLFCTNQRPPSILPAVLAATSLGIPTATFIFSWDNLSSKGRIAAPFDHYLVWSDQMRKELLQFYPSVSSEQIHVLGTPQFESYGDKSLLVSREEFFKEIGADAKRPLICYSGGDTSICPEDEEHVRILMELIQSGKIKGQPQVLLRPSPVDEGSRYARARRDFPKLIYAPPAWVQTDPNDWAAFFPSAEDVRFLANLTHHADLNVNVSSTMTLDFAIHDKPVVNIAFDVASPPPFGVSLWENHYQFDHYRPVVEFGAARFARSPDELADHVNAYLANPQLDRDGRRRFVELEVRQPLSGASQRIAKVLRSIAVSN